MNYIKEDTTIPDKGFIALITPTGARPLQISLCAMFMKRQTYTGNVVWVVVDDYIPISTDCIEENFKENWTILKVFPSPPWQVGQNTQSRNLAVGIDTLMKNYKKEEISAIFIIEDDDYYKEIYLEQMMLRMKDYWVIGEKNTTYYNLPYRKYVTHKNVDHSSLFQTAFTVDAIPAFERCYGQRFIDMHFFRTAKNVHLFNAGDLAIGMKGILGRDGIGMGHQPGAAMNFDPEYKMLRQLIGTDIEFYYDEINRINEANRVAELNRINESNRLAAVNEANKLAKIAQINKIEEDKQAERVGRVSSAAELNRINESNRIVRTNETARQIRLRKISKLKELASSAESNNTVILGEEKEVKRPKGITRLVRINKLDKANGNARFKEANRINEENRLTKIAEANRIAALHETNRLARLAETDRIAVFNETNRLARLAELNRIIEINEANRIIKIKEAEGLTKLTRIAAIEEVNRLAKIDKINRTNESNRLIRIAQANKIARDKENERILALNEANRIASIAEINRITEANKQARIAEADRINRMHEANGMKRMTRLEKVTEANRKARQKEQEELNKLKTA